MMRSPTTRSTGSEMCRFKLHHIARTKIQHSHSSGISRDPNCNVASSSMSYNRLNPLDTLHLIRRNLSFHRLVHQSISSVDSHRLSTTIQRLQLSPSMLARPHRMCLPRNNQTTDAQLGFGMLRQRQTQHRSHRQTRQLPRPQSHRRKLQHSSHLRLSHQLPHPRPRLARRRRGRPP